MLGRADDDDMRAIASELLGEPTTADGTATWPMTTRNLLACWTCETAASQWTRPGRREADAEPPGMRQSSLRDELIDAVLHG
jgi:hypothetical protein